MEDAAEAGHGGDEAARVGVARRAEHLGRRPGLDHAAAIHHRHAVRRLGDDADIVGDEEDARALPLAEVAQQIEHLRLHRDVERRRRLVGDDEAGPAGERHGDHDALAHAAREMVRILRQPPLRLGDADGFEKLHGAGAKGRAIEVEMETQGFRDLGADGEERIERRQRILEDRADVAPAHDGARLVAPRMADGAQGAALEADRAAGDPTRRLEAEDGRAERRLARAGLAHEAMDLARLDGEVGAVDRQEVRQALAREGHVEAADLEERRRLCGSRAGLRVLAHRSFGLR